MIRMDRYRAFWEEEAGKIEEITGVLPVTVDEDMAKKIKALPLGSISLFWIPPTVVGDGKNVDMYRERNRCVVFVMEKYDPSRRDSLDVLTSTQPVIEKVKRAILSVSGISCSPWRLEDMQLTTMPETRFFAGFAGWSVGFSLID